MKKALVILLALSMVFAAFADDPAVLNEIAEFKGSATVTWGVDLDAKSTGFRNDTSASLKFNLINDGSKSTTGEGVWGEIAVSLDSDDGVRYVDGSWETVKVTVDKAKLHINDMIAVGILSGSNAYGKYEPITAVKSKGHFPTANVGGNVKQGITLEVALPDLLDLNIDFRSEDITDADGTKADYTNNYGIGTSLAVKAVENLNLKLGFGIDFYGNNPWGLSASADYKLGLSDTMYLKPQVAFTMTDAADSGKIAAALLVGWGSENQDTNIKWISQKVSDGFSVATEIPFASNAAIPLCVGVWDSTFVENLKVGAQFHMDNLSDFDAGNTLAFEFAYTLGDIKPAFAFAMDNGGDLAWTDALKICFTLDYTGIANTTFTLGYESGNLKASTAQIGQIWTSAKISF